MDIQNLLSQLTQANNPLQMLMGLISPQQQNQVSQLQNKSEYEQAEMLSKLCNEKGITKSDLEQIMKLLGK